MSLLEILYIIGAGIALIACVPQLRQLIVTKRSDEFSAQTWILWSATQAITLVYVISIHNILMIAVNILWVSFYILMTYLILHYGHFANAVTVPDQVTSTEP